MPLTFFLLLIPSITLYLGGHYFIYFSLTRFFSLSDRTAEYLAAVFISLPFLFFLATLIVHWRTNRFTKYLYVFSALWLGLMMNLSVSFFFGWLIFFILKLAGLEQGMDFFLGAISFLYALILSGWGISNALNIDVKSVEVKIKNLPAAWREKKVVQVSDVHLGNVYGGRFLKRVVDKINSLEPDIVFITGDLFDGVRGRMSYLLPILNEMSAKEGIFYVTGNHEYYVGLNKVLELLKKTKIRVLDNEAVEIGGLQILGASFPFGDQAARGEADFRGFKRGLPTILLYHTPTDLMFKRMNDALRQAKIYWAPEVGFSAVRSLGVNLQLSGHTHKGQLFPFNILTKMIYRGYDYGLRTLGDFNIYISSGVGTWGPPMRTVVDSEIVLFDLK